MPPLPHNLPHESASRLEAGQSKGLEEKPSSYHTHVHRSSRTGITSESRTRTERMPSAGRLLLVLLFSFLVTFGLATALSPGDWHRRPYRKEDAARQSVEGTAAEGGTFTSLLEAASPASLHELLHKYFPQRFKDGVWESDLTAVEAVRRVDAALAVSIVKLARRADNGTTTSVPPTTVPPTTVPPTTVPPTTSAPPPPASTTTEPPPPVTTTSRPGGGTTTSPAEPSNTSPAPATTSSRTTTTDRRNTSAASTPITNRPTFTSSPSLKPVTSTFTSTMADGGVVVVTTTSYVDPDPVKTTGPTSKRPTPTLQNAAPARQNQAQGALFGLVVGAALLI